MAATWYYQLLGETFGPVTIDGLRALIEKGSVDASDLVRDGDAGEWITIREFTARELQPAATMPPSVQVQSAPNTSEAAASANPPSRPLGGSDALMATAGSDGDTQTELWYCKVFGQELGPLSFEELTEFAKSGELSTNDEVRFGTDGRWRRAGSIGRLMAVMPYQASTRTIEGNTASTNVRGNQLISPTAGTTGTTLRPAMKSTGSAGPTTSPEAASVNGPVAATSAAAPATAALEKPAPAPAPVEIPVVQPVHVPTVEETLGPQLQGPWFAWVRGQEFGPIEAKQLIEWVQSGQLSATDYVRQGVYGQYAPAASLVQWIQSTAQSVQVAQLQAQLAAAQQQAALATEAAQRAATAPVASSVASPATSAPASATATTPAVPAKPALKIPPPTKTSEAGEASAESARKDSAAKAPDSDEAKPAEPKPAPAEPADKPRPPANDGWSTPSSAARPPMPAAASRVPPRPMPARKGSSGGGLGAALGSPVVLGGLGGVAGLAAIVYLVMLLGGGNGPQIALLKKLEPLHQQVAAKLEAGAVDEAKNLLRQISKDFKNEEARLAKIANKTKPAEQNLLFYLRRAKNPGSDEATLKGNMVDMDSFLRKAKEFLRL